ncbi:MAG: hypothetical protein AMXMBFR64_34570 [Myxococcales bacterium]
MTRARTWLLLALGAAAGCGGGEGAFFAALQDAISAGPDASVAVAATPDVHATEEDVWVIGRADVSGADVGDVPGEPSSVVLDAVIPSLGSTGGGEIVAVTGTGFLPGATVLFGGTAGAYTFVESEGRLLVMTPAHAPGRVDVEVVVPDGDRGLLPSAFEFASPVHIDAVAPPVGPVAGGTPIEVLGSGFLPGSVLLVGGLPAISPLVIDEGRIQAITPPGVPGPADIHVSTPSGGGKKDGGFFYTSAPEVDALDPWSGTAFGGTKLRLVGAAMPAGTEVWLAGEPATVVEPGDGTSITVLTPGGPPGPVDVVVANEHAATLLPGAYTYTAETTAPTLWNLWPHQGSQAGGEVVTLTVTGLGDAEDLIVRFGAVPATVVSVSAQANTIVAKTPAFPAPGPVDVTVQAGTQESTLKAAYLVLAPLVVTGITPGTGPSEGGTPIVVSGQGFGPASELRVGPLPASAVAVVDDQTIQAVTPAGSAGYADVHVVDGDRKATLTGGFLYTGADGLVVHALEPTAGAMAGSTYVEIYGSGFVPGTQVLFGDTPAASVTVVSPVVLAVYSPPGFVETVDLTVITPAATKVLSGAWTWFNPLSDKGGTWGGQIDGSVNVSVLDGMTGGPVGGAVVVLGAGEKAWVRIADDNGQTTFSKKGLFGPVQITATKGAPPMKYSAYSLVDYDAKNATIYLIPEIPPQPGGGGGVTVPAQVSGRVFGMDKYILPPPGDCAKKIASGQVSAYCQPCQDTAECTAVGAGPGWVCAELLQPDWTLAPFCTTACSVNADCPTGYVCGAAGGASHCHPAPPQRAAFCMTSKENHFGYQPLFDATQRVDEEGNYSVTARVGELAIVCWGGWVDELGAFTPSVMGVRRHVFTWSGGLIDGQDVTLNIPAQHTLRARFLEPPTHPSGLSSPYFKFSLQLDGEDGYIQVPEAPLDPKGPLFEFRGYPERLDGPLFGATYSFYTSLYAATTTGMPYGVVFAQGVADIVGESVVVRSEGGWTPLGKEIRRDLAGIWGAPGGDLWAVGPGGLIVRGGPAGWWPQGAIVKSDLNAVWGSASDDVWAVGAGGVALHFDGLLWSLVPTGTLEDLHDVWGAGPSDVYAVGDGGVLHWDGGSWTPVPLDHTKLLTGVTGDAGNLWAVGADGKVVHRSGQSWVASFVAPGQSLHAVWAGDGLVVAVGDGGTVRVRKGGAWSEVPVPTTATLRGVWGRAANDVVVVGDGGTILRWDGVAWHDESDPTLGVDLRAVWTGPEGGAAVGHFSVLIGPFMPFPKITTPMDGASLTDHRITWDLPAAAVDIHGVTLSAENGSPAWQMLVDGDVDRVDLPDFQALQALEVLPPGAIRMNLTHIRFNAATPFDLNSYISQDLSLYRRFTWSIGQVVSW